VLLSLQQQQYQIKAVGRAALYYIGTGSSSHSVSVLWACSLFVFRSGKLCLYVVGRCAVPGYVPSSSLISG
jgi:hypothetical protein